MESLQSTRKILCQRLWLAKQDGIDIYVVGISSGINEQEIKDVSSPPNREGSTYWMSSDFLALDGIVNGILKETCNAQEWRANEGKNIKCEIDGLLKFQEC